MVSLSLLIKYTALNVRDISIYFNKIINKLRSDFLKLPWVLNIDLHCKFKFIKSSYQENAKLSDLICSNRHIYWNFAGKLHIILVSRGRRWACAQYLPDGRSQLFRQVKYVNYIRFPDGRGYRFNHKELRQGSGVNSLPTCRL